MAHGRPPNWNFSHHLLKFCFFITIFHNAFGFTKLFTNNSLPTEKQPLFLINFELASVICQRSEDPKDLQLLELSILCDGKHDCFPSPAINDESFQFCRPGQCEGMTCSNRGACLFDGEKPRCFCNSGTFGRNCEQSVPNDCAVMGCHRLAQCDQGECQCPAGFVGNGISCEDVDECRNEGACADGMECVNLPGSFYCKCSDGFMPIEVHPNGSCMSISDCHANLFRCLRLPCQHQKCPGVDQRCVNLKYGGNTCCSMDSKEPECKEELEAQESSDSKSAHANAEEKTKARAKVRLHQQGEAGGDEDGRSEGEAEHSGKEDQHEHGQLTGSNGSNEGGESQRLEEGKNEQEANGEGHEHEEAGGNRRLEAGGELLVFGAGKGGLNGGRNEENGNQIFGEEKGKLEAGSSQIIGTGGRNEGEEGQSHSGNIGKSNEKFGSELGQGFGSIPEDEAGQLTGEEARISQGQETGGRSRQETGGELLVFGSGKSTAGQSQLLTGGRNGNEEGGPVPLSGDGNGKGNENHGGSIGLEIKGKGDKEESQKVEVESENGQTFKEGEAEGKAGQRIGEEAGIGSHGFGQGTNQETGGSRRLETGGELLVTGAGKGGKNGGRNEEEQTGIAGRKEGEEGHNQNESNGKTQERVGSGHGQGLNGIPEVEASRGIGEEAKIPSGGQEAGGNSQSETGGQLLLFGSGKGTVGQGQIHTGGRNEEGGPVPFSGDGNGKGNGNHGESVGLEIRGKAGEKEGQKVGVEAEGNAKENGRSEHVQPFKEGKAEGEAGHGIGEDAGGNNRLEAGGELLVFGAGKGGQNGGRNEGKEENGTGGRSDGEEGPIHGGNNGKTQEGDGSRHGQGLGAIPEVGAGQGIGEEARIPSDGQEAGGNSRSETRGQLLLVGTGQAGSELLGGARIGEVPFGGDGKEVGQGGIIGNGGGIGEGKNDQEVGTENGGAGEGTETGNVGQEAGSKSRSETGRQLLLINAGRSGSELLGGTRIGEVPFGGDGKEIDQGIFGNGGRIGEAGQAGLGKPFGGGSEEAEIGPGTNERESGGIVLIARPPSPSSGELPKVDIAGGAGLELSQFGLGTAAPEAANTASISLPELPEEAEKSGETMMGQVSGRAGEVDNEVGLWIGRKPGEQQTSTPSEEEIGNGNGKTVEGGGKELGSVPHGQGGKIEGEAGLEVGRVPWNNVFQTTEAAAETTEGWTAELEGGNRREQTESTLVEEGAESTTEAGSSHSPELGLVIGRWGVPTTAEAEATTETTDEATASTTSERTSTYIPSPASSSSSSAASSTAPSVVPSSSQSSSPSTASTSRPTTAPSSRSTASTSTTSFSSTTRPTTITSAASTSSSTSTRQTSTVPSSTSRPSTTTASSTSRATTSSSTARTASSSTASLTTAQTTPVKEATTVKTSTSTTASSTNPQTTRRVFTTSSSIASTSSLPTSTTSRPSSSSIIWRASSTTPRPTTTTYRSTTSQSTRPTIRISSSSTLSPAHTSSSTSRRPSSIATTPSSTTRKSSSTPTSSSTRATPSSTFSSSSTSRTTPTHMTTTSSCSTAKPDEATTIEGETGLIIGREAGAKPVTPCKQPELGQPTIAGPVREKGEYSSEAPALFTLPQSTTEETTSQSTASAAAFSLITASTEKISSSTAKPSVEEISLPEAALSSSPSLSSTSTFNIEETTPSTSSSAPILTASTFEASSPESINQSTSTTPKEDFFESSTGNPTEGKQSSSSSSRPVVESSTALLHFTDAPGLNSGISAFTPTEALTVPEGEEGEERGTQQTTTVASTTLLLAPTKSVESTTGLPELEVEEGERPEGVGKHDKTSSQVIDATTERILVETAVSSKPAPSSSASTTSLISTVPAEVESTSPPSTAKTTGKESERTSSKSPDIEIDEGEQPEGVGKQATHEKTSSMKLEATTEMIVMETAETSRTASPSSASTTSSSSSVSTELGSTSSSAAAKTTDKESGKTSSKSPEVEVEESEKPEGVRKQGIFGQTSSQRMEATTEASTLEFHQNTRPAPIFNASTATSSNTVDRNNTPSIAKTTEESGKTSSKPPEVEIDEGERPEGELVDGSKLAKNKTDIEYSSTASPMPSSTSSSEAISSISTQTAASSSTPNTESTILPSTMSSIKVEAASSSSTAQPDEETTSSSLVEKTSTTGRPELEIDEGEKPEGELVDGSRPAKGKTESSSMSSAFSTSALPPDASSIVPSSEASFASSTAIPSSSSSTQTNVPTEQQTEAASSITSSLASSTIASTSEIISSTELNLPNSNTPEATSESVALASSPASTASSIRHLSEIPSTSPEVSSSTTQSSTSSPIPEVRHKQPEAKTNENPTAATTSMPTASQSSTTSSAQPKVPKVATTEASVGTTQKELKEMTTQSLETTSSSSPSPPELSSSTSTASTKNATLSSEASITMPSTISGSSLTTEANGLLSSTFVDYTETEGNSTLQTTEHSTSSSLFEQKTSASSSIVSNLLSSSTPTTSETSSSTEVILPIFFASSSTLESEASFTTPSSTVTASSNATSTSSSSSTKYTASSSEAPSSALPNPTSESIESSRIYSNSSSSVFEEISTTNPTISSTTGQEAGSSQASSTNPTTSSSVSSSEQPVTGTSASIELFTTSSKISTESALTSTSNAAKLVSSSVVPFSEAASSTVTPTTSSSILPNNLTSEATEQSSTSTNFLTDLLSTTSSSRSIEVSSSTEAIFPHSEAGSSTSSVVTSTPSVTPNNTLSTTSSLITKLSQEQTTTLSGLEGSSSSSSTASSSAALTIETTAPIPSPSSTPLDNTSTTANSSSSQSSKLSEVETTTSKSFEGESSSTSIASSSEAYSSQQTTLASSSLPSSTASSTSVQTVNESSTSLPPETTSRNPVRTTSWPDWLVPWETESSTPEGELEFGLVIGSTSSAAPETTGPVEEFEGSTASTSRLPTTSSSSSIPKEDGSTSTSSTGRTTTDAAERTSEKLSSTETSTESHISTPAATTGPVLLLSSQKGKKEVEGTTEVTSSNGPSSTASTSTLEESSIAPSSTSQSMTSSSVPDDGAATSTASSSSNPVVQKGTSSQPEQPEAAFTGQNGSSSTSPPDSASSTSTNEETSVVNSTPEDATLPSSETSSSRASTPESPASTVLYSSTSASLAGIQTTTKDTFKLPDFEASPIPPGYGCTSHAQCGPDAICDQKICQCLPGFVGNPPSRPCIDVDECTLKLDNCHETARCQNFIGGFACFCAPGFRKRQDGECEDIDECTELGANACHVNAKCRNLPGSFLCECAMGFTGDGQQSCVPIGRKPCNPVERTHSECGQHQECLTDGDGRLECGKCARGFRLQAGVCVDIDECNPKTGSKRCHPQAQCRNIEGSFRCQCPRGWLGDGIRQCAPPGSTCLLPHAAGCPRGAVCLWQGGNGTACQCPAGTRLDPRTEACIDVDECAEGRHNCDPVVSQCTNLASGHGFQCRCRAGFEGRGGLCVDVDECQRGMAACHPLAHCVNQPGSYACRCAPGYSGDGVVECKEESTPSTSEQPEIGCPQEWVDLCRVTNKTCLVDDEEVPQCGGCLLGFQPMSGKCVAVNSLGNCADPAKNDCHLHADCIDIPPGKHFCSCRPGFIGDGMRCDDVDECSLLGICDPNAHCRNLVGSYECHCRAPFLGDGHKCVLPPENFASTTSALTTASTPQTTVSQLFGQCSAASAQSRCHPLASCKQGRCQCPPGTRGDGMSECTNECNPSESDSSSSLCVPNAECDGNTKLCQCKPGFMGDAYTGCFPDRWDCEARGRAICSEFADCVDRRCTCKSGFTGDGTVCVPTAVPEQGRINCAACHCKAKCVEGRCQCEEGFLGNGLLCVPDPQDCVHYPGLCHPNLAVCHTGKRRCQCRKGFSGNGIHCKLVLSCLADSSLCHPQAVCMSSGQCRCRAGFTGDGTECWKTAVGVTPRPSSQCPKCPPNAECLNGACKCAAGFVQNAEGFCQDVDECRLGLASCVAQAICLNSEGSYRCECPEGMAGDGRECVEVAVETLAGPEVECLAESAMRVRFPAERMRSSPTQMFIVVNGQHQPNPHCFKEFTSPENGVLQFMVPKQCGTQTTMANGTRHLVELHVQRNLKLPAQIFKLECLYPLISTPSTAVTVTKIPLPEEGTGGKEPTCTLEVTNQLGRPVRRSQAGELLTLSLNATPTGNAGASIFPKNCYAINLDNGGRYCLTDEDGCAFESALFPEWQLLGRFSAQAKFQSFRWPTTNTVRFECDCSVCTVTCPKIDCSAHRQRIRPNRRRFRIVRRDSGSAESIGNGIHGHSKVSSSLVLMQVEARRRRRRRQAESPQKAADSASKSPPTWPFWWAATAVLLTGICLLVILRNWNRNNKNRWNRI